MKIAFAHVLALSLSFAAPAFAADKAPKKPAAAVASEVTLKGTIGCAKCALKETTSCQNVLMVKDGAKETKYYIENNEVAKANHGKVCGGTAPATVTGTVKDGKDGKKTLTPTAIAFEG